jgi:hypothetical protein
MKGGLTLPLQIKQKLTMLGIQSKIILVYESSLSTDFWYRANFLNYINTTNPDNSGVLSWMVKELQAAEDAGERVWIVSHVLSGWDGSNPLQNPTDLLYQIVDRY